MQTEGVNVTFTEDGIAAIARIAAEVNRSVENIGARRLYTIMERVFEELSFQAPDRSGESVTVRRQCGGAVTVRRHQPLCVVKPDLFPGQRRR